MKYAFIPVCLMIFFMDLSFSKSILTNQIKTQYDKPLFYKPGDFLYVLASSGLNIRQNPDIGSNKLTNVPYGEKVLVLKDKNPRKAFEFEGIKGFWAFSEYQEIKGYAFDGYLSRLPSPNLRYHSIEKYLDNQIGKMNKPVTNYYPASGTGQSNQQVKIKYQDGIEFTKTTTENEYTIYLKIRNIRVEEAFLILKLLKIEALNGLDSFPLTNMSFYAVDVRNDVALEKEILITRKEGIVNSFDLRAGVPQSGYTGFLSIKTVSTDSIEINIGGRMY